MDPQKTGNLIAKLRKEMELTQKDLAYKLNVTPKAISRWETGRGYPDIEFLPKLSKALNISINELLNGELSSNNMAEKIADEPIIYVCNNATQKNRRSRKKIIWLSIGLAMTTVFLLSFILSAVFSAASIINSIDPNCVIAKDYSYILYQNEKYVPIDTDGYVLCDKDKLVEEASVEGQSNFDKLLFGDSIYSVVGIENDIVIHLVTDFDYPLSDYYVKESELENIKEYIENFNEKNVYIMNSAYSQFSDEETISTDKLAENDFWDMLFSLPESADPDASLRDKEIIRYSDSLSVITSDENNFIYKAKGEIFCIKKKYYWVECKVNSFNENYHPSLQQAYPIDAKYYSTIKSLFSAKKQYEQQYVQSISIFDLLKNNGLFSF